MIETRRARIGYGLTLFAVGGAATSIARALSGELGYFYAAIIYISLYVIGTLLLRQDPSAKKVSFWKYRPQVPSGWLIGLFLLVIGVYVGVGLISDWIRNGMIYDFGAISLGFVCYLFWRVHQ